MTGKSGGCIWRAMPKVRGNPAEKWTRRAGAASADYQAGVNNPRNDWAQATAASAAAQAAGAQAAIARGSFAKGVQRVGSSKWASKATGKGALRYGPGVADAQEDYANGVGEYLKVIENTKLPVRGPKGDPTNINRVIAMNKALRDAKLMRQGR